MKVTQIDYHRNGVSGQPFHIVKFHTGRGGSRQNFVAVVFESGEPKENCRTAVFDFDKLKSGETRFLHNSFRGDYFDKELREAIAAQYRAEKGLTK